MEIGIDIEQNNRFSGKPQSFIKSIFCDEEIEYANRFQKAHEHYCAFWCVKEAVIKAFGDKSLGVKDICTLHDTSGKPYVKINQKLKDNLTSLNLSEIKISISHSKEYATAVCIIC